MLASNQILEKLGDLNIYNQRGMRAPHKPLVLIYYFGLLQKGAEQLIYGEHQKLLKRLIEEFGPPTKNARPNYPFTRLRNDGIWKISSEYDIPDDASDGALANTKGALIPEWIQAIKTTPSLIKEACQLLLDNNFPATLHASILNACGVEFGQEIGQNARRTRDPSFREKVLNTYDRRCAVCNYQIRLRDALIGVEAAHVKWHAAEGPDIVTNGIALCHAHHQLFDYGAFCISPEGVFEASFYVNGNEAYDQLIKQYDGKPINAPKDPTHAPDPQFLAWQKNQVFKG